MKHMLAFGLGLGAGFVLGTRAGRDKYEAIARTGQQLWEHPTTQSAAAAVQHQADRLASTAKDMVSRTPGASEPSFAQVPSAGRSSAGVRVTQSGPKSAPTGNKVSAARDTDAAAHKLADDWVDSIELPEGEIPEVEGKVSVARDTDAAAHKLADDWVDSIDDSAATAIDNVERGT